MSRSDAAEKDLLVLVCDSRCVDADAIPSAVCVPKTYRANVLQLSVQHDSLRAAKALAMFPHLLVSHIHLPRKVCAPLINVTEATVRKLHRCVLDLRVCRRNASRQRERGG